MPIVVLSADGSEDRKVDALDQGADDYMTKPFGMRELDARLRVALRHHHGPDNGQHPAELDVGTLHLDLVHYEGTFNGQPLDLTPKEFDFLAYLARNVGKVCTRRMILESVWGPGYEKELHYLKVYAYRLRRKLADETGGSCRATRRSATGWRRPATDGWPAGRAAPAPEPRYLAPFISVLACSVPAFSGPAFGRSGLAGSARPARNPSR